MGISTANVPALAVAATVFLLNVVAKIGIEAVSAGAGDDVLNAAAEAIVEYDRSLRALRGAAVSPGQLRTFRALALGNSAEALNVFER